MTKTMNNPSDRCYMCGNTREWHDNNYSRHAFSMTPAELRDTTRVDKPSQTQSGPPITRTTRPFDPVLRLALIEAGVITTDQIEAAEKQLNVVMSAVNNVMGED